MTDKSNISLSRRKLLGSLGAVGVASAGAGLGTTAYFSDEESFTNNTFTAGELNLAVEYYSEWAQDTSGSVTGVADGPAVSSELTDVKPGDSGTAAFCFTIDSNPAYMWACGELTENDDNGLTDPEEAVDDTGGPGEGDLADAVDATLQYCDVTRSNGEIDGVDSTGTTIASGSLREILALLRTGVPLDGNGDGAVPGEQTEYAGTGQNGSATNPCVCIDWSVPTSVGNEIQGDSLAFELTFYAQQARNNDGANNPCADAVLTSDATGGIRESDNWLTASVSAGPTTVINVVLDGEVYGGGSSGLGEWPSNADVYFMEANIDIGNDGIDEAANDDDFRVGFAAADSGARAGAISNSTAGASGNGGYIRRNTGGSNSGDAANRTDVAAEDVPGFFAFESADQLGYTFILDWSMIAGDSDGTTAQLSSAPAEIQINEVFGGDGGEGVAATPNSSNDGRGDVDNVTDGSGTLTL